MITALSAIANGGVLMKPFIVEKITDEKGHVVQSFQPEVVRKVVTEETAKKVVALLKATTERGGTGEGAVPAGFEVAGKTGTAPSGSACARFCVGHSARRRSNSPRSAATRQPAPNCQTTQGQGQWQPWRRPWPVERPGGPRRRRLPLAIKASGNLANRRQSRQKLPNQVRITA